jgi:hypothetical protein
MVYPALLPLMRAPRLLVVDWTDAPADLNKLVRFAERRNLVSARVPSHFNCPLPLVVECYVNLWRSEETGHCLCRPAHSTGVSCGCSALTYVTFIRVTWWRGRANTPQNFFLLIFYFWGGVRIIAKNDFELRHAYLYVCLYVRPSVRIKKSFLPKHGFN